jgi:hypothetical protein
VSAKHKRIVEVEWTDSCSQGGWGTTESHLSNHPSTCRTVGYLLARDKRRITVVQSQSDTTLNVAEGMSIPAFAVKRIRYIGKTGGRH